MTNMERTLTAMYDTRDAAESTRDQLVALGVPSSDVSIEGSASGSATTAGQTQERGFWASLFAPDEDRHAYAEGINRGGYLLAARAQPGLEDEAIDVLERSGAVDLDERTASWRQEGWKDHDAAAVAPVVGATPVAVADVDASRATAAAAPAPAATAPATARAVEGAETIQVVEEQLRVGKREVGRGSVRVRSYVREIPVEEQVELRQERVSVERRPVDRPLAPGEAAAAFQERTIEATARGEEAVVSKSARVVEEIAVRKDVETEVQTVRDTVHRTEVEVEDDRGLAAGTRAGAATTTDVGTTTGVGGTSRADVADADGMVPPARTNR